MSNLVVLPKVLSTKENLRWAAENLLKAIEDESILNIISVVRSVDKEGNHNVHVYHSGGVTLVEMIGYLQYAAMKMYESVGQCCEECIDRSSK